MDDVEIRLECLRVALEYGTQRDVLNPDHLADKYYEWVMQGGLKNLGVSVRVAHRN
jgi:hypothetical protein